MDARTNRNKKNSLGRRLAVALTCVVALAPVIAHAAPAGGDCAALRGRKLAHVDIVAADEVRGGGFVAPDAIRYDVPNFCRIQGEASSSRDSQIRFEVWMPANGWNGRYYQLGNGGFAGTIPYSLLAAELRRGNVVAATDTGHRGNAFDASWARGHPEKIVDYGWRSLKQTSDAAHALIRAYYGAAASHRYFAGCSNGGRQALMLAQRFPHDWDGILAGAPPLNWTGQLATFAQIQHTLRSDPESWIEPAKLSAIQDAAMASCSPAAQIVDGVPTDPRSCRFDPVALICEGEETDQCLTRKQAAALAQIQHGRFGFEPTAAAVTANWEQWIVNEDRQTPSQFVLAEQFFRNMVFADVDWRLDHFDPSRDSALAQRAQVAGQSLDSVLNPASADLSSLKRGGAKLLMYFGWADALISPRAGVAYYEEVLGRMAGVEKTQAFFRLFMVPGMTHCQGGPGPHVFGQSAVTPGLHDDPAHDIRRALEVWVERGVAPQSIVAVKYVNDDPAQGVSTTKVLCPFPKTVDCRTRDEGES
jgi:feruloyl esterase